MKSDTPNTEEETLDPTLEDCGCDIPQMDGADVDVDPETDATQPEEAAQAAEELLKWRETAMRTAAEYDNYRKRCVKDREDFMRYASRNLLEELLPVVDNFEVGMQMAQGDTSSMIYIGMDMVRKQLHDFLANQGVEPINTTIGEPFDHNKHEAIQNEASEEHPEGAVIRIIRKGYNHKGKLLRPVNVVTASKPQTEGEEA